MVGCGGDTVWSIADRNADNDSAGRRNRPALTRLSAIRLGPQASEEELFNERYVRQGRGGGQVGDNIVNIPPITQRWCRPLLGPQASQVIHESCTLGVDYLPQVRSHDDSLTRARHAELSFVKSPGPIRVSGGDRNPLPCQSCTAERRMCDKSRPNRGCDDSSIRPSAGECARPRPA
jgi:hypothetical protein